MGGETRQGSEADEPKAFDLLDRHIQAVLEREYWGPDGATDYFPPDIDTLPKRRAYVLEQSPGILDALKTAYEDNANSLLHSAVNGVGHQGTLEAPVKAKTF